jgi:hypothetical protein
MVQGSYIRLSHHIHHGFAIQPEHYLEASIENVVIGSSTSVVPSDFARYTPRLTFVYFRLIN